MYKESSIRSVAKSISWRFWATVSTIALVLLFTGETEIALSIGLVEIVLKIIIYFFHERAWDKIKLGRHEITPFVLWITGLPKSGKSSIANEIYKRLSNNGIKVEHLDGANIRNLFPKTGFSKKDVEEHVERVGYLANKLEMNGIFVIASFVSPYRESREFVRNLCENFIEVYLSTPVEVCEKRDQKGLYKKAREKEISNFPGINYQYEVSDNPDLIIDTTNGNIQEHCDKIINYLSKYL